MDYSGDRGVLCSQISHCPEHQPCSVKGESLRGLSDSEGDGTAALETSEYFYQLIWLNIPEDLNFIDTMG
jgi:hypothetical protein